MRHLIADTVRRPAQSQLGKITGAENGVTFVADSPADSSGNTRAITSDTLPSHGSLSFDTKGTSDESDDVMTYTPNTDYVGGIMAHA